MVEFESPFITKQAKRGVKNEHLGLYAAQVEYVGDPLNLGRIKARVPGINDPDASRTPSVNLPWTLPCFTPGTFIVPDVGETVWVMFQRGQVDYPVYFGTWPGITTTPRVRGRLAVFAPPEPKLDVSGSGSQDVPTATGAGLPNDLAFLAGENKIVKISGGLDGFLAGFQFQVTGSLLNNSTFTVLTNSGLVLQTVEALVAEDSSGATLTGITAPPRANNTKSYVEPPGNESPAESYARKGSVDPAVRVLAKSPKGHTIYSIDDDEAETLVMVDRAGAQLIFKNPVTADANANNKARRVLGEANSKTATKITDLVNGAGLIKLIDVLGQFLDLVASGAKKSVVELHGVPGDSGFFRIAQDGNLVTIWSDRKSIIKIDQSIVGTSSGKAMFEFLDDGTARLTSAPLGATIDMPPDGSITLTAKVTGAPSTITMDGSGISLDNGQGATLKLVGSTILENGG